MEKPKNKTQAQIEREKYRAQPYLPTYMKKLALLNALKKYELLKREIFK